MIVLTAEQKTELDALNESGNPRKRLSPRALTDGRFALPEDLLTDMGEGQTWAHYAAFLTGKPTEDVTDLIPQDEG